MVVVDRVKSKEGKEKRFATQINKNKSSGKCNAVKQADRDLPELLSGEEFSDVRKRPDLYLKVMEKLQ